MNKIILKIWYSCNHRCDFCHAEYNKQITDKETLKTIKKLFYIKKNLKDIDTILLSWWEPTIQDNFFKLLELSSSLWFKTWVVTNWSILYKKEFLDKCLQNNFVDIYLSIHWWSEKVHNTMTWTNNSFDQIEKLLNILERKSINLSINCVITKNNIDFLEEVILFIQKYWAKKIKFSLLEPKWLWYTDLDKLFVSPDKVSIEIIKIIKKYPNMNIWWDWLPLCLFKWYEDKISNLQTENIMYMSETYEDEIFNTDYGLREYSEKCIWCKLKESCSWNFKIYNELYWSNYLIKN
jgi:MoaA/NifB/PqqE/SkfB family radical SAM enzyme